MRVIPSLTALCVIALSANAQARSGMLNVGDAEINYDISGQGKPIVFINGWALTLDIWDDQVAAFAPRYRVLRYDLRGFGKSTGHADFTADPDDLRILLDSLGIRSAYLVGLSRGAAIAQAFVVAFPERVDALVLYGSGPLPGFPIPPDMRMRFPFDEIARKHGMDSVRTAIANSPLAWRPPNRPDLDERLRRTLAVYEGRDLLDPRPPSGRVPPPLWGKVSEIRVPTLVIYGDHEMPLFQLVADSLVRRIPNARRVVIKNGGHGAHGAQPEQFNKALSEFFASVDRSAPTPRR